MVSDSWKREEMLKVTFDKKKKKGMERKQGGKDEERHQGHRLKLKTETEQKQKAKQRPREEGGESPLLSTYQ